MKPAEKHIDTLFTAWQERDTGGNTRGGQSLTPTGAAEADYKAAHDAMLDALQSTGKLAEMEERFTDCIYTAQRAAYFAGFEAARELFR